MEENSSGLFPFEEPVNEIIDELFINAPSTRQGSINVIRYYRHVNKGFNETDALKEVKRPVPMNPNSSLLEDQSLEQPSS